MRDIFRALRHDDAIRAVLMTGGGGKFMETSSMKMDRNEIEARLTRPDIVAKFLDISRETIWNVIEFDKPLVAAVNGIAHGEACRWALLADFVIASDQASFSDGHVNAGVAAGDGGVLMWPLLVGMGHAKRWLMTGDAIEAREAERIGLIGRVVPHDAVLTEGMAWARRMADGPTYAARMTKQALHQYYRLFASTGFDYSVWVQLATMASPEGREGIRASLEGRKPNWPR